MLVTILAVSLVPACGGGGGGGGPGDAEEATGSAPSVLPPDDPGAGGGAPPGLEGWVAVDSTGTFELTLSLADPIQGPRAPGTPTYPPNQPIGVLLQLRNRTDQSQTFTATDDPIFWIDAWHEATGEHVFARIALFVPPYPVTFGPGETRIHGQTWFPGSFPLGRYRVEGRITTTDPRVPGPLQLVLDVE